MSEALSRLVTPLGDAPVEDSDLSTIVMGVFRLFEQWVGWAGHGKWVLLGR